MVILRIFLTLLKKQNMKAKTQNKGLLSQRQYLEKYRGFSTTTLALIISGILLTGCSSTVDVWGNKDLQINASEEGIQAFFDGVVGTAMAGKHKDNLPERTPSTELRALQSNNRTLRAGFKYQPKPTAIRRDK